MIVNVNAIHKGQIEARLSILMSIDIATLAPHLLLKLINFTNITT